MDFDFQAMELSTMTQAQALAFIRKEAEAGRSLSPLSIKILADRFDPDIDHRGPPEAALDLSLVYEAGYLRAIWQYWNEVKPEMEKALPRKDFEETDRAIRLRESWKDSCKSTSDSAIDRQIYGIGKPFYEHAYLCQSIKFWAGGLIKDLKTGRISIEAVERAALSLELSGEISTSQYFEICSKIGMTAKIPQE